MTPSGAPSDPGAPQLSVVLSTLGNHAGLGRVLAGYERQDAPKGSFELLVVSDLGEPDQGAVERVVDASARPYPVRLLRGGRPGLSANRNAGWQAARAPLVLFTDNDTIPVPRLVSEHLASHARHPETEVAVIGLVRWARWLRVTPFMRWLDRGFQFDFGSLRGEAGTWAHVYGANLSVKRAMLERVGGYEEEQLPYGYEDLDWGYRARAHGLRVVFNRKAVVDHDKVDTLERWQRQQVARLARAERTFCRLHPDVAPFFHGHFSQAAQTAPGRGTGARLARYVPRWFPWLGPVVWRRAELHWLQVLAPAFMQAWEGAEREDEAAGLAGG